MARDGFAAFQCSPPLHVLSDGARAEVERYGRMHGEGGSALLCFAHLSRTNIPAGDGMRALNETQIESGVVFFAVYRGVTRVDPSYDGLGGMESWRLKLT